MGRGTGGSEPPVSRTFYFRFRPPSVVVPASFSHFYCKNLLRKKKLNVAIHFSNSPSSCHFGTPASPLSSPTSRLFSPGLPPSCPLPRFRESIGDFHRSKLAGYLGGFIQIHAALARSHMNALLPVETTIDQTTETMQRKTIVTATLEDQHNYKLTRTFTIQDSRAFGSWFYILYVFLSSGIRRSTCFADRTIRLAIAIRNYACKISINL